MTKAGRALVAGGAGFIGSWLCHSLSQKGLEVICLDNLSSGRRENICHLDVEFIEHDITFPIELKVDYIFHLASRASPPDFAKYPIQIMSANSLGTYNLLRLAKKNRARFLLASSSEVYGDAQQSPQREDYWGSVNPVGLRSCYDEGKRFSEALTMAFHREFGLDVRIARIFNTYGERMRSDDGRVIPNFISQALQHRPISVYGSGIQTRSFCYVSDLINGLIRFMFIEELSGEVLNIGNPNEISILQVAKLVKKLTRSKSPIAFESLPEGDPRRRKPDITKAKEKLNWLPVVNLTEGLSRTIEYFIHQIEAT